MFICRVSTIGRTAWTILSNTCRKKTVNVLPDIKVHFRNLFYFVLNKKIDKNGLDQGGIVIQLYSHLSGLIWRLIFQKAVGDTNEAYVEQSRGFFSKFFCCRRYDKYNIGQKKLKNIWDQQNFMCMSPYHPYTTDENQSKLWRLYEINELHHRDIFRTMDRIKLVYSMLKSSINIFKLSQPQYKLIESFGPLHDIYQLNY